METTIVAIDGPSGVGKSTTSRRVAAALGIPHIDTGAMYRAIALKALALDVDLTDSEALERLAENAHIEFRDRRIFLDGVDVTHEIRSPEISMAASNVSAVPAVRRVLVRLQQELGRRGGGVLEGRDIGTRVFPDTPHKFYLDARPEVRAARRYRELLEKGAAADLAEVSAEMIRRDRQDSTRVDSPLRRDDSYAYVDTSDLSVDQVVDRIVELVRAKRAKP